MFPTLNPPAKLIPPILIIPPLRPAKCPESRSGYLNAVLQGGLDSPLGVSRKVVERLENATLWACDGESTQTNNPRRAGRSWILSCDHHYRDNERQYHSTRMARTMYRRIE